MALNEPDTEVLQRLGEITPVHAPTAAYLKEPRGRYTGQAAGVLRPENTAQIAAIMRVCNAHKVGVIPYGGGTGLVGGQVMEGIPRSIILSLERMHAVRDIHASDNVMVVDAGAILQDIQRAAENARRIFPLSLASEGSCQIGGNLATNAGGVNVLRYGNARALCLGLEAVLPDGTVFNGLKRLPKDNTGYDLRDLLIGAEGTLGIITAATLKIFPKPVDIEVAFINVATPQTALDLLNHMAARFGNNISAFELIHRQGLDFLAETGLAFAAPLAGRPEWMVLVECGMGAESGLKERFEDSLAEAFEGNFLQDAAIAQNLAQQRAFWDIRENIPEANRKIGVISSHDISVPVSTIPAFITQGKQIVAKINPAFRVNCFGHLGDGNLHYNVYPPQGVNRAEFDDIRGEIKDSIYDLVESFGGSFSAEHGIGRMKKADLAKYGDTGKLTAMRAIKQALDPNGIMNPGAVI